MPFHNHVNILNTSDTGDFMSCVSDHNFYKSMTYFIFQPYLLPLGETELVLCKAFCHILRLKGLVT